MSMTFSALLAEHPWEPIPNCEGRWILRGVSPVPPEELSLSNQAAQVFRDTGSQDPVHVVAMHGGGLISYRKIDGTFRHTLNSADGFRRKLDKLGIPSAGSH